MNEEEDDLESLFDLDKNRLDEEWVAQPKFFRKYAERLVELKEDWERARADHDWIKDDLEVVDAMIARDVRLNPSAHGIEGKPTVDAVHDAVVVNAEHKKAVIKVREARLKVIKCSKRMGKMQVAVDSFDHRKKALENLVSLRLAEYYSEPRAKGKAGRQMREAKTDRAFGRRNDGQ